MDNKKRTMAGYGEDRCTGKAKVRAGRTTNAVPPTYKIPAGKDIMLKDILYRINNREYGDMFADKDWLEARLSELSYHKPKSSYEGTDYSIEKGRRVHTKITKEELEARVSNMLEELNAQIYAHTMPAQVVSEATNVLADVEATADEKRECSKALSEVIKFLSEDDAPDIYFLEPKYDRKTGEYERYPIKKEEVLEVAMDVKIQLDESLKTAPVIHDTFDEECEPEN